jgi:hypothetical protein
MRKVLLHSALAAITAAAFTWPSAAAESRLEYEVKAAFLYNFAKFVEWPVGAFPDADSALELCIYGDDPFGPIIDRIVQSRTVQGRPIIVQHEVETTSLSACHLLFVGPVASEEMARIVQLTGGTPVLTVGETDWFIDSGGMIRLFLEGGKVRFEVNAGVAEQAQLKVSSQLLKLARTVRR